MLSSLCAFLIQAQDTAGAQAGAIDFGAFPWIQVVVTLLAGAAGGLVYELIILQGAVEHGHALAQGEVNVPLPHAVAANAYDWGVWARLIIGALAAVAVQLVFTPETWITLVATSVVAGSAGISVFQSLQNRLLTSIAETKVTTLRAQIEESKVEVDRQILDVRTRAAGTGVPPEAVLEGLSRLSGLLSRSV